MAGPGRPPGAEQKGRRIKAALLRYADAHPDKLDEFAARLWTTALRCDVSAMRELADRIDGKVAQAIVGDSDHPPVQVERIERVIVDAQNIIDAQKVPIVIGTNGSQFNTDDPDSPRISSPVEPGPI